MFKTIIKGVAIFAIFMGLMMIAGSANDCDGACVEQANTLGEMLAVMAMGFFLMIAGGFVVAKV